MTAVKLFKIRRGERTFRRLDEGNAIRLEATIDDRIIIGFSGVFDSDVIINGDLTVNGTTTTINSTTHDINDNVIVLNDGEIGAGVVTLGTVSGFEVDRGSEDNVRWVWDEVIDKFRGEFVTSGLIAAVEVDQLMFTDHGSNAQMWSIEEDSSGATNSLTFDYASTERLRITTSGEIADSNNNVVLSFSSTNENGVNWVDVKNTSTGSGPIIRSVGADTNIDLNISSKGTGTIFLNSTTDVDVLAFRDHGANSQQWTIEEDSASATNDLTFDYSGVERLRITPSGTVDGRDLAVDGTKLDGIEDNATRDQTAAEILAALLTVDGTGTLLDADFLDGLDSTAFLQNVVEDTTPQLGGNLNASTFGIGFGGSQLVLAFASGGEAAVNNIELVHAVTGLGPIVRSVGSDTNVDLNIETKGTGAVVLDGLSWPIVDGTNGQVLTTDGVGSLSFADGGGTLDNIVEDLTPQLGANLDANTFDIEEEGNVVLSFTSGSEAAVNWVDVKNATTGVGPTIRSVGADTNVDLNISAKGTGIINLGSGGVKLNANLDANGNSIIRSGNIVLSFASFGEFAVNWIDVENADTGLGPTITVKGPDTNVDLNIEAKGLGRVNITNDSAVAGAFVNDALDTLDVAVTTIQGLHYLGAFVVASLPSAAANTNRLALATDAGGGRTLVISNGSDWHVFAVEGAIVTA